MPLFEKGGQFPPQDSIQRLAKYKRGKKIFDGNVIEIYERASELLKDTPHAPQLQKLYIAVNIMDILCTKPADLLVGEPPKYESGKDHASIEQQRINSIAEENDLTQLLHEITTGNGYRGDAWLKTYYNVRQDMSAIPEGLRIPSVSPEPIIESINASHVFPELARGSSKKFKAINIAWIEYVETRNDEKVFLNVERHVPNYIIYERFALEDKGVDTTWGVPIPTFYIGDKVATGRDNDVIETGVPSLLVEHVPYKSVDDNWQGISVVEKLESVLAAINDRLVQIDYILWKHSDPTAYGPEIDGGGDSTRFGGKYIPMRKDDATPGYMIWNGQLDAAFKELDMLLGIVFQMSETPQWLFGTTLTPDSGGTGTSHTDGVAIKARFMPILSKVKRIRTYVDKAIRDSLWKAQILENFANEEVDDFTPYEPVYPTITWSDGLPKNEKELAEVMQIRTGGKPTIDVQSAIKKQDDVDDIQARQTIERIDDDETRANGFVDASIFNAETEAEDSGGDE